MLDLVLTVALLGVATTGLASFLRALPWPKRLLDKKPLACPVCMSGWSAFAVLASAMHAGLLDGWSVQHFAIAWCFCIGVSAPIFKALYPPEVELPLP